MQFDGPANNFALKAAFDGDAVSVKFSDGGPVCLDHNRIRCDLAVDMTGQFHEAWHGKITGQLCPGGKMRAPAI